MNTSLYACGPPSWLPSILKRASHTPAWLLEAGFWQTPAGDAVRTDADDIAYMDVFTASPAGVWQTCIQQANQTGFWQIL